LDQLNKAEFGLRSRLRLF